MDFQKTDKIQNNDLLLDIRNQDEIENMKYNNEDGKYKSILYIPSTLIKYNLEFLLDYFSHYDNVYIICKSGNRSKKVKDRYFVKYDNVKVNTKHFDNLTKDEIIISDGINLSVPRKIQIISGSIIFFLFCFLLFYDKVKYMFLFLGLFMIYVGISGNCFMSSILANDDI